MRMKILFFYYHPQEENVAPMGTFWRHKTSQNLQLPYRNHRKWTFPIHSP